MTARVRPAVTRRTLAVCLALSAASLLLSVALTYDSWSWLVWGRELAGLELDTTGGPSWKPLPVLITTVLSMFGDLAPTLWLLVARVTALIGIVLVFRLAARFGGRTAGVVAVALLALTPDAGPRFLLLVATGHSAPMVVTACLWSIERHLAGRHAHALLLLVAAGLLRPEAWVFLGLYAAWLWRQDPTQRRLVVLALPVVPLLWFGGDWLGSGDPWHGAGAAAVVDGSVTSRLWLALERTANVVVIPAWVAAVGAVMVSARRRERTTVALGVAALGWFVIVASMTTVLGYAGLSRFLLPAGALVCVLAGIGGAWAWSAVRRNHWRTLAFGLALVASLPLVLPRATAVADITEQVDRQAALLGDLVEAVDRAGGPDVVASCGKIALRPDWLLHPALAWKLDLPLSRIARRLGDQQGVAILRSIGNEETPPEPSSGPVQVLGRSNRWTVYAVGCMP